MKKTFIAISLVLILLAAAGCGVKQEDYDKLSSDFKELQQKYNSLQQNFEKLSSDNRELLQKYSTLQKDYDALKAQTARPPAPAGYNLDITVDPAGSGSVTPSSGAYDRGSQVTLRAVPSGPGWKFDRWTGDVTSKDNPVSLTLDSRKNIVAIFTRVKFNLSVGVEPPGSGSVGPTGGTYDYGNIVSVTATPSEGYEFDRWSGDASGSSDSTTVTMESDKKITAHFKTLFQIIKRDMPAGAMALNTVSFTTTLKAGQKIQGFVELTGEYQAGDATASWNFSLTGPQTVIVENWEGNVLSSKRREFDKVAPFDGIYEIKVRHNSRWPKALTLQVKPAGWN